MSNLSIPVAFSLALLAACGLLSTPSNLRLITSIGFATAVVVFWILPSVSPVLIAATGGRAGLRPIGLALHSYELWHGFGRLPFDVRLERLETARGRPHLWPLMRETALRCGSDGNVVVWASPADGDAYPSQYMFQRSSYLLYPSKVFFAQRPEQLADLRRRGPFSALIAYGTQPPHEISGKVVYTHAPDFMVLCAPRL